MRHLSVPSSILAGVALGPVVLAQTTIVRPHYAWREYTLSGTVVRADGSPVEGADVVLRAEERRVPIERGRTTTSANGRFSFATEAFPHEGQKYLEIDAAGFAPTIVECVPYGPSSADIGAIAVLPFMELRGRVTTRSGEPIAGAKLHAMAGGEPRDDELACPRTSRIIAVTDEHGEFVARELAPGRVALGASADGFADLVPARRELTSLGSDRMDFALEPERAVRLELRSASGARLEGIEIAPMGLAGDCGGWPAPDERLAFWRRPESSSGSSIDVHGLSSAFAGKLVVTANGHRPELVPVDASTRSITLQPSSFVEVTAARGPDQTMPEIYSVVIRDDTSPTSWCGDGEDPHWLRRWRDSPGVERLAPNHWRIAWNTKECYVEGGRPQRAMIWTTDGDRAIVEHPVPSPDGVGVGFQAALNAPARWSGTVRDATGAPVSLRLGIQLSMYHEDMLSTMSDEQGQFAFDELGAGPNWLISLDERWTVQRTNPEGELKPGGVLHSNVLVVPSRAPTVGRVRGKLRIDGRAPGEPILLALNQQSWRSADGYAWTDAEGNFEISAREAGKYQVVPKHRAPLASWRSFPTEFPKHDDSWRCSIVIPEAGVREVVLELPPEGTWDRGAEKK